MIVSLNLYEPLLRLEYSSGKEIGLTHKSGNKFVGRLFVNLPRRALLDDTSLFMTAIRVESASASS